jgi:hypothetical protein
MLNLGCLHPVACVRSGDGSFYIRLRNVATVVWEVSPQFGDLWEDPIEGSYIIPPAEIDAEVKRTGERTWHSESV